MITSYPHLASDKANNPLGFFGAGRDQYLSRNRADGSFFSVGRNRALMDTQWTAHLTTLSGRSCSADLGRFDTLEAAIKACEASPKVLECGYCGDIYTATPRTKPICNSCLQDAGY